MVFCPLLFSPPFLASPAFFCAALFLLTKAAIPFLPSFAALEADKHAAYASPFLPSPHLPNFWPSLPYLSQPPPVVEPVFPLPNHFLKSSFIRFHENWNVSQLPDPAESKTHGRWSEYAKKILEERRHLSLIANITQSQIKRLENAGINTINPIAVNGNEVATTILFIPVGTPFIFTLTVVVDDDGTGSGIVGEENETNNENQELSDDSSIDELKKGTDDYLSKPFEPEELFLRINNLLKLYENINQQELLFSFGSFIYNTKTNSLKLNDKEIYLTEGENNLLLKLINNRNNTLSREELAEKEFDESELRKVDVGITRLRQKIEKIPKQPQYIKTIRGKGYMLICKEI